MTRDEAFLKLEQALFDLKATHRGKFGGDFSERAKRKREMLWPIYQRAKDELTAILRKERQDGHA